MNDDETILKTYRIHRTLMFNVYYSFTTDFLSIYN